MSARHTSCALLAVAAVVLLRPQFGLGAQDSSARRRAAALLAAPAQRPPATQTTARRDTLRNVPPVVGSTVKVATELIARAGLQTRVMRVRSTGAPQPGRVVRQNPVAGTAVGVGSTVTIYVDAARIDTTRFDPTRATVVGAKTPVPGDVFAVVPNVVGSPALAAPATLKREGLTGYYIPPVPNDLERAIVIRQSHAPLTRVDPLTRIGLVVAIDTMTTVPTVLRMNSGQVRRALEEATLRSVERQLPDANVPSGLVVRQRPEGGARVPIGSPVLVLYSTGPPPVAVPNLAGRTREDAVRLLVGAGLRPGRVDTVNSPSSSGRVVWQDPPAGASVPARTVVQFHIGRRAPDTTVVVPGLIGLTLDRAAMALRRVRLGLHFVDSLPDSARAATIIRQEPERGASTQPGADVHVWTARPFPPQRPESIVVPNVVGLTRDEAAARLRAVRLGVGRELAGQRGTPGRVSQQNPAAGSRDTVGAAVNLFIVPEPSVDSTLVPAVTELLVDSALVALEQARLRARLTDPRAAGEPIQWVVESQTPVAGLRVPVSSAVTLVVQHVPDSVIVPNVVSHRVDSARALVDIGRLTFAVGQRRFALHLRETVLSQTPPGGQRVLRGATVSVDVSRPLTWPLALATLPLLGYAITKTPLWPRHPKPPKPPITFSVRGNTTRTPLPEITPDTNLLSLEITLEFALGEADSFVDGITGPITLDREDSNA